MSVFSSTASAARGGPLRRLTTAPVLTLLATSILLGLLFVHLGSEVREGDTLTTDQAALRTIDRDTTAVPVPVASTVSLPGAEVVVGGLGLMATIVLLWRRRVPDALLVAGAVGGYAVLTFAVKQLVGRQRPVAFFRVPESGPGFPSGHTVGVTCLAVAAGYLLWRSRWPIAAKVTLTLGLVVAVVLVGGSRLVLGVHYPTDVLGGLLLGGAWMAVLLAARCASERWRGRQTVVPSRL